MLPVAADASGRRRLVFPGSFRADPPVQIEEEAFDPFGQQHRGVTSRAGKTGGFLFSSVLPMMKRTSPSSSVSGNLTISTQASRPEVKRFFTIRNWPTGSSIILLRSSWAFSFSE
jgi:hypothetical protein